MTVSNGTARDAAVFLDRDGTIIEDRGHLKDSRDVVLLPGAVDALLRLQEKYRLFVVTNQPGVSRGEISAEDAMMINRHLDAVLREYGIDIERWYVCPHDRAEKCECSKPSPYFLKQAAADFNIALNKSFFIGDHPHDAMTGFNAGAFGIHVCTGHGMHHIGQLAWDILVFRDLYDASGWIMRHPDPVNDIAEVARKGAEIIRSGGLVAFPTETVYGLGANAFDYHAAARIFEAKQRPAFDPLICHVASVEQVMDLAAEWPEKAALLAEKFWPGPLTMILPKRPEVPDLVTSGLPSVGIRMPANRIALELIKAAQTPIAAPSANLFGRISPTRAEHVREQLEDRVDLIIDGGCCRVGVESTIISFAHDIPVMLRPGGISAEQIEAVIGPVARKPEKPVISAPEGPGMLLSHYAPSTPMKLVDKVEQLDDDPKTGYLLFTGWAGIPVADNIEILSPGGDMAEAAANLFAAMRRLDALDLSEIIAEKVPEEGVGAAINDRLHRAAWKEEN